MQVNDWFDIIGGLFTLALVALFLTKPNTANDITVVGTQFTGALKQAQAGG